MDYGLYLLLTVSRVALNIFLRGSKELARRVYSVLYTNMFS